MAKTFKKNFMKRPIFIHVIEDHTLWDTVYMFCFPTILLNQFKKRVFPWLVVGGVSTPRNLDTIDAIKGN